MKTNKIIEYIGLCSNYIGDEGAKAIAKLLKINQTIIGVDLEDNNIGPEGIAAIVEALKENKTLTFLNLSGGWYYSSSCENKIGDEASNAITELLNRNKQFVKDTAEFLLNKFINKDKISDHIEGIKYLKHYQVCDKSLFAKYFKDINTGSVRLNKLIEFVDNYIAENFLVIRGVAKGTDVKPFSIEGLPGEIFSYVDKSLWPVKIDEKPSSLGNNDSTNSNSGIDAGPVLLGNTDSTDSGVEL